MCPAGLLPTRLTSHCNGRCSYLRSHLNSAAMGPSTASAHRTTMRREPKPPAAAEPQLSLLVPIAAWPAPPRHDVTCICVTSLPRAALVCGSSAGQVCLWGVEDGLGDDGDEEHAAAVSLRLSPRVTLLGHSAPVMWWVASCPFFRYTSGVPCPCCARSMACCAHCGEPIDTGGTVPCSIDFQTSSRMQIITSQTM